MTYSIVQGDLDPPMPMQILVAADGLEIDTALDTIELVYRDPDGDEYTVTLDIATAYVESPPEGELVDATTGQLRRIWVDGETAVPGIYEGRIRRTREDRPRSFPNDSAPFTWTVLPLFSPGLDA